MGLYGLVEHLSPLTFQDSGQGGLLFRCFIVHGLAGQGLWKQMMGRRLDSDMIDEVDTGVSGQSRVMPTKRVGGLRDAQHGRFFLKTESSKLACSFLPGTLARGLRKDSKGNGLIFE